MTIVSTRIPRGSRVESASDKKKISSAKQFPPGTNTDNQHFSNLIHSVVNAYLNNLWILHKLLFLEQKVTLKKYEEKKNSFQDLVSKINSKRSNYELFDLSVAHHWWIILSTVNFGLHDVLDIFFLVQIMIR